MSISSPLPSLTQVSHYQIQQLAGQGTFSRVYKAKDTSDRRHPQRALLELIIQGGDEEVRIRRRTFKRMAEILAKLNHQKRQSLAFPRVYQTFEADNRLFLVQEFIEGVTYGEYLEGKHAPLSAAELEQVFHQALVGLAELHRARIIHRDIKPGNLMRRSRDSSTVIIDFGAACDLSLANQAAPTVIGDVAVTRVVGGAATTEIGRTRIYTPGYAHPDQRDGLAPVSPRWDLYALAKTFIALRLGSDPPWPHNWSIQQLGFSARMQALLREMLKLEDCRFVDANDALRFELPTNASVAAPVTAPRRKSAAKKKPNKLRRFWQQEGETWIERGRVIAIVTVILAGIGLLFWKPWAPSGKEAAASSGNLQPIPACPNYVKTEPDLPVPDRGFAARFNYPDAAAHGDSELQVWKNGVKIAQARDEDIQGFIWIKSMAANVNLDTDFPLGDYEVHLIVPGSVPYKQKVTLSPEFPFHYLGRVNAVKVTCAANKTPETTQKAPETTQKVPEPTQKAPESIN
ncbi:MAG: serine/threonine protein kinase [Cyanothece sp. SIO1E1]|nr:serine/threonine protein kinase [Cyanothece sp. SIO1E1]